MSGIIDFLVDAKVMDFVTDPRVIFAAVALFIASLFFRWRILGLTLFGVGALVAVAHYSKLTEGKAAMDRDLLFFSIGSFVVIVIVIYFLFIRGD